GPLARGTRLRPTPIWGIGHAGNSVVYSEQFRSVHGTRRALYGSLNGALNRTLEGEVQHEAARVHHAARWGGDSVAAGGAGAAARAHEADRCAHTVARRPPGCQGAPRGIFGILKATGLVRGSKRAYRGPVVCWRSDDHPQERGGIGLART